MKMTLDPELASEPKALVALAFRNGPIEALHAGHPCPQCSGNADISHISDVEMKHLMKSAVMLSIACCGYESTIRGRMTNAWRLAAATPRIGTTPN